MDRDYAFYSYGNYMLYKLMFIEVELIVVHVRYLHRLVKESIEEHTTHHRRSAIEAKHIE